MAEIAMAILPLELYFSLKTTLVFVVYIVKQKSQTENCILSLSSYNFPSVIPGCLFRM